MELLLTALGVIVFTLLMCIGRALRKSQHLANEDVSTLITIGRATVSLTHDLNNLLLVIGGYAEVIQQEERVLRLGTMAGKIEDACLCARRMTDHILSLVRDQDEEPMLVNVTGHLRTVESVLSDLAGTSTDVQIEGTVNPLWVSLRKSSLDQILINLVVNSREARATSIKIEVSEAGCSRREHQPKLKLQVLDNGSGFGATALKLASSEYFSMGKSGGAGIGLATIERLVRLAHGSLSLGNRRNMEGAVVQIELPLQSAGVSDL